MEEIFQAMQQLVAEQYAKEPEEVTMDTSFEEDLGADSLDAVELNMALEEEFNLSISDEVLVNFVTVKDIVEYIDSQKA